MKRTARRTRGRYGRHAVGLGLTLTLGISMSALVGADVPAQAVDDSRNAIQVSTDGEHWSPGLTAPLFDPAARWVPGDSRVAGFLVRNFADSDAWLAVEASYLPQATTENPNGADSNDTDLELSVRVDGAAWELLADGIPSTKLTLAANDENAAPARIELRATLPETVGNQAQGESAAFAVNVSLQEAAPQESMPQDPGSTGPAVPSGPGSELALTGAGSPAGLMPGWWLAAGALAAVAVGAGTSMLTGRLRTRNARAGSRAPEQNGSDG